MKRPYDQRSYFSESGYVTHEHEEALQAKATAAEESYRRSERRQRNAFWVLLLVFLLSVAAGALWMARVWQDASEPWKATPEPILRNGGASLQPGESRWSEDGKLQLFSM